MELGRLPKSTKIGLRYGRTNGHTDSNYSRALLLKTCFDKILSFLYKCVPKILNISKSRFVIKVMKVFLVRSPKRLFIFRKSSKIKSPGKKNITL